MSGFKIFCMPNELNPWLEDLRRAKGLAAIYFSRCEDHGIRVAVECPLKLVLEIYCLWLQPEKSTRLTGARFVDVEQARLFEWRLV